ncbi:hypothetical protein MMC12_004886 [Toensbergia leucococca]|nr:hypothetical protein [Toensbergia leucococca]
MVQNKGLIFKSIPEGWPVPGKDLAIEARDFDSNAPPPKDGITVKLYYASLDPYQRGRMRAPEIKSYAPPFELGEPITNAAIAKVLKSNTDKFSEGDIVIGPLPFEEYGSLDASTTKGLKKLQNPYNLDPKLYLGALGMPGLTAYSSFYAIGQPKKGETIFISAASGAVGQIVGQLAKHEGLTVIGSVGNDEKLEFIKKELNFDEGFHYKKESPSDALARLAPKGIDIYYENVGGEHLDAALGALTNFGRIGTFSLITPPPSPPSQKFKASTNDNAIQVTCGMISQYNSKTDEVYGVKNMPLVVSKRLQMQGFIVTDPNMGPVYAAEHQKNVAKWIHEGSFKAKMSLTQGIENSIEGLIGMWKGENFGKAVLVVAELPAGEKV